MFELTLIVKPVQIDSMFASPHLANLCTIKLSLPCLLIMVALHV